MVHKSPFERLKSYYHETELECPECGYFDESGEWTAETNGNTIEYSHTCPSCQTTQTHSLQK